MAELTNLESRIAELLSLAAASKELHTRLSRIDD